MSGDRGTVSFYFGGVKRICKVTLGLAVDVEEATGRGCMALVSDYGSRNARITTSLEILRVTLAANNTTYSETEMRELFAHEGIAETHDTAVKILAKLFANPKKSARGNAPAPSPAETADATQ